MESNIPLQQTNEEMQTRRAQHAALRAEVSEALTRHMTLPEMLQRCTEAMVHHLHDAFARIWTLRPGEDVLVLQASAGMYTHLNGEHGRIHLGDLEIGMIARERRPLLTNEVQTDPHITDKQWARRERMIALAGYPLLMVSVWGGAWGMFSPKGFMGETFTRLP